MRNKSKWELTLIVEVVAVILLCIFGVQSSQNRAIALEEQINTASSDNKVQNKCREDLVYDLADTVKQYDKHEAVTLNAIVIGRGSTGDIENVTTAITAVSEVYQELKSNVTKREILASISIIAVMLLIGVLISSKISKHQLDKNEIYNKAVKIKSQDLFQHGMNTNVGNAFVYGDLKVVDTVTYPEIGGEYMSVEKVMERYTRHTRTVTKTRTVDGKSQTYNETEVYWTWDAIDRWSKHCNKVTFLGIEFDYGQIYIPKEQRIDVQKESSNIRYVYYGSGTKYTGTIFTSLKDNTINNTSFYNGRNIEEAIEDFESNVGVIIFWVFWFILTSGFVFSFFYVSA